MRKKMRKADKKMIITEKYNKRYIINIFFNDGTEKTIEDVAGYYIDTDTDIVSIIFNKYKLSYDKYYIKTIESLEIIPIG